MSVNVWKMEGNTLNITCNYALNCTTSLFNIEAPTYFGSGLPSSESFLDLSELLEMQVEYSICLSSNPAGSKKLPDAGRLLPKHIEACILNK
jgi:hypothetical protein